MAEENPNTAEEWRPVVGFEDRYAVSNMGRVKRTARGFGTHVGRVLRPHVTTTGRGYLSIGIETNGHQRRYLIHRLVAAAFLPADPTRTHVNHKNGDTKDNRVENLEWVTNAENLWHKRIVLNEGSNKLTEEAVREIRERARQGELHRNIARAYGLAQSTVTRIVNRLSWPHV